MSKELVISANRHETRVAVVEDDQVVEVYHQRENEYSLAGSIHKGRVTRVLPGMQSAFVDIGLERDAFLYVSDFFEDNEEYDKIVTSVEDKVLKLDRAGQPAAAPPEVAAAAAAEAAPAGMEAAAPSEAAAIAPPAAAPAQGFGAPPDLRRDERDHRGRRSRRRRGKGGRGLPDSKFYSPGHRGGGEAGPPTAVLIPEALPKPDAELEPGAMPPAIAEADDLFVLPGESLAKYKEESAEPDVAAEAEPAMETYASAEAEPAEPEVEAAPVLEAQPIAEEQSAEELAAPTAAAPALETPAGTADRSEYAESGIEEGGELAEPVPADVQTTEAVEAAEPAEQDVQSVDADEPVAEEVQPGEPVEALAPEEGPEPARIPTSLTATLREQGPRYLHRVSRRMRRKGREGRGPVAEATRAPDIRPQDSRSEVKTAPAPRGVAEPRSEKPGPSISDLLKEGQEIIVQIAKEPLGQKGARITSHIALPGRFLVYMPTVDHIGVSRKIPSDDERLRLKRILQSNRSGIPGGYIVRTAGEGRSEEELRADMMFLYNLWLDMRQKAERRPAPLLIHHDLNVVERILRDQLTSSFKSIWVDNEEVYEGVLSFVQRFQPALIGRVKLYTRANPVFDEFNITAELEKALRPKVWLKSGGYIVINQTEALVAIDINTGKYVGKSNRLEDTIVKTNTDAVKEIVRQIRLRDLGGIIVVDFIDMDERKNRQKVMQALEEAMRADRAPNKILQFNDFGLVAITRKRVKQSLERTLCTPCPYCEGAGYVKSPQTVVGEILQEANKIARSVDGKDVMLRVSPDVAKLLKSNQNTYLQELEEILGKTVIVKSDPLLHQEKFDLA
ncbi:MAG TPA: Rne/Rng family ribonuclease [Bryobacteraceae bacterium]|nr:Rne/Rng family ribonuclease [Bryobacteraceae bacterium]